MDFFGLAVKRHEIDTRFETKPNLIGTFHSCHREHIRFGKQVIELVSAVVARHAYLRSVEVVTAEDFLCVGEQARAFVGASPNGALIVYSEATDRAKEFAVACSRVEVDRLVVSRIVESAIVVEDNDFAITARNPFVVVMVDEQCANVDGANATAKIEGMPSAIGLHCRKEVGCSRVGYPQVAFAVEGQATDVDEARVTDPVVQ